MNIKVFLSILLTFLVLDYIILVKIFGSMWREQVMKIQGEEAEFRPLVAGTLTYLLMTTAIYVFAVKESSSLNESLWKGALIGLAMYGVFDGTNYVLFKHYRLETAIIDILCGVFVCTCASFVGYKLNY